MAKARLGAGVIAGRGFAKVLSKGDLWLTVGSDLTCEANVERRIGQWSIPAQTEVHLGSGDGSQPYNQGYLYFALYDDTATNSVLEEGTVRIGLTNYMETVTQWVYSNRTEALRGDVNDISKKVPLPEVTSYIDASLNRENSKVIVAFTSDSADILVESAIGTALGLDVWAVPITIFQ